MQATNKVRRMATQPPTKCLCNVRVRCPHYFRFLYLNLSRGTGRNWSALSAAEAALTRLPIPATAQAPTLAARRHDDSE